MIATALLFWAQPYHPLVSSATPAPTLLIAFDTSSLIDDPYESWHKAISVQDWVESKKQAAEQELRKQQEQTKARPKQQPRRAVSYNTTGVEQWRPLVEKYFGANTDAALSVMRKESGGNPSATNGSSGAAGLFQHLPRYWDARAERAGFAGTSPYDPEANIAASALLSNGGADWSHWVAKP